MLLLIMLSVPVETEVKDTERAMVSTTQTLIMK